MKNWFSPRTIANLLAAIVLLFVVAIATSNIWRSANATKPQLQESKQMIEQYESPISSGEETEQAQEAKSVARNQTQDSTSKDQLERSRIYFGATPTKNPQKSMSTFSNRTFQSSLSDLGIGRTERSKVTSGYSDELLLPAGDMIYPGMIIDRTLFDLEGKIEECADDGWLSKNRKPLEVNFFIRGSMPKEDRRLVEEIRRSTAPLDKSRISRLLGNNATLDLKNTESFAAQFDVARKRAIAPDFEKAIEGTIVKSFSTRSKGEVVDSLKLSASFRSKANFLIGDAETRVQSNSDTQSQQSTESVYICFFLSQTYYTASLANPPMANSIIDGAAAPSPTTFPRANPLYVSEVAYGRYAFLVYEQRIDTDEKSSSLNALYGFNGSAKFAGFGGSASGDFSTENRSQMKSLLENATLYKVIQGGPAIAMPEGVGVDQVFELQKQIQLPLKADDIQLGVPISCTARNIYDGTVAGFCPLNAPFDLVRKQAFPYRVTILGDEFICDDAHGGLFEHKGTFRTKLFNDSRVLVDATFDAESKTALFGLVKVGERGHGNVFQTTSALAANPELKIEIWESDMDGEKDEGRDDSLHSETFGRGKARVLDVRDMYRRMLKSYQQRGASGALSEQDKINGRIDLEIKTKWNNRLKLGLYPEWTLDSPTKDEVDSFLKD